MRGLVQRVSRAKVTVGVQIVGEIGAGSLVLVGVTHDDTPAQAAKLADKIWNLRIFDDVDGVMNLSLADTSREVLVVSQFTLAADTSRGNRPGFSSAASPVEGRKLYEYFAEAVAALGIRVETGEFGADMQVALVNDGPVTICLDTKAN